LGEQWGGHGSRWGTDPERLLVSCTTNYNRAREIRRQNNHTAQTVNGSKFNENALNMHAKKSSLRT